MKGKKIMYKTLVEVADSMLPRELHRKYDTALPQPWVDELDKFTGFDARGSFVWLYDRFGAIFGRPFPLTANGRRALLEYNIATGSEYLTTQRVEI